MVKALGNFFANLVGALSGMGDITPATPAPFTPFPSASATPEPSIALTSAPTPAPTVDPTISPTTKPVDDRTFEQMDNTIAAENSDAWNEQQDSQCAIEASMQCVTCDRRRPATPMCEGRPFEMLMRYTGENCRESRNGQDYNDKFYCEQFQEPDAAAYIVVTTLKDDTVYFSGWVTVGETFVLSDGGNRFAADQLITVYNSQDTDDPSNVVQSIQYHTSCAYELSIGDTFGSVMVLGYINEDQGSVTAFVNQTVELTVFAYEDLGDILSMSAWSETDPNVQVDIPTTDATRMFEGDRFVTWFGVTTDLTKGAVQDLRAVIYIHNERTGQLCDGSARTNLTVGGYVRTPAPYMYYTPAPAPVRSDWPIFYETMEPTHAPTSSMPPYYYHYPTVSAPHWYHYPTMEPTEAPTYDSMPPYYYQYPTVSAPYWHHYPTVEAPHMYYTPAPAPTYNLCDLSTEIECATASGNSCDNLLPPAETVCNDREVLELEFLVTGNSCDWSMMDGCFDTYWDNRLDYESEVFVEVYDFQGEQRFAGNVALGDTFRISGPFGADSHLYVVIGNVWNTYGSPPEELQFLEALPVGCSGSWGDLALYNDYGALRLVGFSTPRQGMISLFENLVFTTTIRNNGEDVIKLTQAEAYNPLEPYPSSNLTHCPIGLSPGASITASTEVALNLADHAGMGFEFSVYTGAQGQQYSRCYDSAWYWLEILYTPPTPPPTTYSPTGLPTCYHVHAPSQAPDPYTMPPIYIRTLPPVFAPSSPPGGVLDMREIVRPVTQYYGKEWYYDEYGEKPYQVKAIEWLEDDEYSYELLAEQIQQRYALACIYFATNAVRTIYTVFEPRGWIDEDNWLGGDHCEWFGVTCDNNGLVDELALASNRLTGSFPPEAAILGPSLTKLDLYRNSVYNAGDAGHEWLTKMWNLKSLYIGQTNFDYNGIPPQIARLTSLVEYDCSFTLYQGYLDGKVFSGLTNLKYLVLSGNAFNSTIPYEIGYLPSLQFFYAQNTFLQGDLSFMAPMESIIELWVDQNPGLQGTIPTYLGNPDTLQSLSLSQCGLSGTIPAEIGNYRNMVSLWLYDNMLSGWVPTEMGNMFKLKTLEMEGNYLTGIVPEDLCLNRIPMGLLKTLEADCDRYSDLECSCCTCCSECMPSN